MQNLNPTLWRTCRALSGAVRIQLLRQLFDHPGRSVSELAKAVGIGRSAACQELRRLQSRGLLQAERQGTSVIYRLGADPQVRSAAPLLHALKSALADLPPERDTDMGSLAFGLAYPRRIAIAQALLAGPQSALELGMKLRLSGFAIFSHLQILQQSGFVQRAHGRFQFAVPPHPLARVLARLLPGS